MYNVLQQVIHWIEEQIWCNSTTLSNTTAYCKPVGRDTVRIDAADHVSV